MINGFTFMGLILETNGVESRDAGTQTELQLDTAPPEQQLPPRFLATMPKLEWLAISGFMFGKKPQRAL